jgi:hypothetical protein
MQFKKILSSFLILFSLFFILISTSRVDTFATSLTIASDFIDPYAVWINKLDQETNIGTDPKLNTNYNLAPYRVTTQNINNFLDYDYILSTGRYDTGTTPNRYIFGTNALNLTSYYNLTHNDLLDPFESLTSTTLSLVLVLNQNLYYSKIDSMLYNYNGGSNGDVHNITPIYSIDSGVTWTKNVQTIMFTTDSFAGSANFGTLGFQSSYLRVGFLFENVENNNASDIYMYTPKMTLTVDSMTDNEQATQFASEIEDYSPCATPENEMIQLTLAKQNEFIDKYTRLSSNAKTLLASIPMGDGFTALERYNYLANFEI